LLPAVIEDTNENEVSNRRAAVDTPKSVKAENHTEREKTWGLFKGLAGIFRFVLLSEIFIRLFNAVTGLLLPS
jgi:hypothetical protein